MRQRQVSYAKMNGFTTGYNSQVTKDQKTVLDRKNINNFPVEFCPECERAFDTRRSNGRGNATNRLLKPKYLPSWYPTLALERALCGFDKCYNKSN